MFSEIALVGAHSCPSNMKTNMTFVSILVNIGAHVETSLSSTQRDRFCFSFFVLWRNKQNAVPARKQTIATALFQQHQK